ncbi:MULTISPECIES: hypothetical protein [Streptomyces]|uniref:hypothetical protein n=1 Tax=Streptomyces TaxID=1883 RepID=UPI001E48D63D|nr:MULTISPECIES: hypothetical protein [Streptomyces]UFQ16395.1 hypothetical protein J2N69_16075 [Streptomyces huasconensis]WCL85998.1 hypothetical protein PPN52_16080 [Streptomyces sp. JCM 35825]
MTSDINRPGYNYSTEVTSALTDRFPELNAKALKKLDQPTMAVIEFIPGHTISFRRLVRDLRGVKGQVVTVHPTRQGKRWVELVDAAEVSALARTLDDLVEDARARKAVKATG